MKTENKTLEKHLIDYGTKKYIESKNKRKKLHYKSK